MVCSKNYVIDKIIRYSSNNFSQYVKELFEYANVKICKCANEHKHIELLDVMVANQKT
jgi:hypothetical protein